MTIDVNLEPRTWAVAVLASRERFDVLKSVVAALLASVRAPTTIDLLINGNPALADEWQGWVRHCQHLSEDAVPVELRVWELALGDKANTWNWYVHHIWPGAALTYFLDGYTVVEPEALNVLAREMTNNPAYLAASGVPTGGRSAESYKRSVIRDGGLHGNLYVLAGDTMQELRERRIRLPLGLYGYDGMIGAMLAFGLNPRVNQWNLKERIGLCLDANWFPLEEKRGVLAKIRVALPRMYRQALRVLVFRAMKDFFVNERKLPEEMPPTVAEFVHRWAVRNPEACRKTLITSPLSIAALRKLRRYRDWSKADNEPICRSCHRGRLSLGTSIGM